MDFIALNRGKLVSILLGSLVFVAMGGFLYFSADWMESRLGPMPLAPFSPRSAGMLGMAFFGATGLYALYKMIDARHGFVLDKEGFLDNSSVASAGRVRWEHVREIREWRMGKSACVVVVVDNPDEVLAEAGWPASIVLRLNQQVAGSPVTLSVTTLDCTHEELLARLRDRWQAWKQLHPQSRSMTQYRSFAA
jgi:hypothetical protein